MTDILTTAANGLGHITLNRPAALHALNTHMCANMIQVLLAWRDDRDIHAILLDHAPGTRGFCAGGDIRMMAESGARQCRHQRADPGAGRVSHLRRLEALCLRRHQPARHGRREVLHQVKTVTARWPEGMTDDSSFVIPTMR